MEAVSGTPRFELFPCFEFLLFCKGCGGCCVATVTGVIWGLVPSFLVLDPQNLFFLAVSFNKNMPVCFGHLKKNLKK